MSSDTTSGVEEETAKHLWKIANTVLKESPGLSKFYVQKLQACSQKERLDVSKKCKTLTCHFCGAFWMPGSCRVRCHSRPNLSKKIKHLLRCQRDEPWKLSSRQRKVTENFKSRTNKMVYTCLSCHKKSELNAFASTKIPEALLKKVTVLHTPLSTAKKQRKRKSDVQNTSSSFIQTPDSNTNKRYSFTNRTNSGKKDNAVKSSPFVTNSNSANKAKKRSLLRQALDEDQTKRKSASGLSGFLLSL